MNKPKKELGISASSYTQFMDCERKWYIGYVIKPDVVKTAALQMGIDVHDWLEAYLKGEEPPDIDEKLVNIAKAGIEYLPEPGTVQVEEWVEDICGPLPFRGKVDFYTCEDGVLHISDHKTTSRSSNAKTEAELALNPQMLAYAYVLANKLNIKPTKIKFSHIYYLTKSKIATSFRVDAEAQWSDVEKNWRDFERVAKVMARLAKAERQEAITPDVSSCRFCWYKEHCTAYLPKKKKKNKETTNKVSEIKPSTRSTKKKEKKGEEDMDIKERIKQQKARQAAAKLAKAKADADLASLELQAATQEASLNHPTAPKDVVDWQRLGDALVRSIEEKEAAGDIFEKESLLDFLLYHLDREIKQEDADSLMEACGHRLVQGANYISLKEEEAPAPVQKAPAKKVATKKAPVKKAAKRTETLGLSNFIDIVQSTKFSKGLPPKWTVEQVQSFWTKVLAALSSEETLGDIRVRTFAKDVSGGSRLPRSSTIKVLVKWVQTVGVPIEMSEEDCALTLGVSDHEQEMAEKLGAVTVAPPMPIPEPVQEKPTPEPVVVAPTPAPVASAPVVQEAPVIVYINAFPSDHIPTKLSTILEPLQDEVAEERGLAYYNLAEYSTGPKLVASKFLAALNGSHASEMLGRSVFASQKDPCLAELLPLLERRADIVIVRGFIG